MEGEGKKSTAPRPPSPEKTEVDVEDEQVERFYALVANIRAMRAMFKASSSCDYSATNGVIIQRKKRRLVEDQSPWRPVFVMEDFRDMVDESAAGGLNRKKARGNGVKEAGAEKKGHGESETVERN